MDFERFSMLFTLQIDNFTNQKEYVFHNNKK